MKIDVDAFVNSLPIMGNGLLGIFIVTAVIVIGIYILRAVTSRKTEPEEAKDMEAAGPEDQEIHAAEKKESAMDLMKEREKKDFLEEDDTYTISNDL